MGARHRGGTPGKPQQLRPLGLRASRRYHANMSSTAPEPSAPEPAQTSEQRHVIAAIAALPCTPCVIDAKQAAALGRDIPEPLQGAIMAQGMLLCDIRHTINVGTPPPPSLLIAPANAIPNGGLA